ncbi:MAG: nicotinate phosphoribosyltransferase [Candidatus Methanomethylophilaceae archaeon]|nr:nicotinate phosphoribosyltransferase [Candidatus Methanomethylophilaceae archaeon]MBR7124699.1 nicotinate phosphoribosyltransferase [Candidatus Methanomethylophilaceae archaeon]
MNPRNIPLLCDFYEYTMCNGYVDNGLSDRIVYFDIFFRRTPDKGGFAIFAGLEQFIEYVKDLRFSDSDIEYLRSKGIFGEDFLRFMKDFRFTGDIWAIPEGTPVFPGEPLVTIRAKASEAQVLETFALLTLNHQSLIATKASRIVRAAEGRQVMEFGSRRAQGTDAAIMGARAAYIAGCGGTACTVSDKWFGVPARGTMAHSWVQMFDTEYDAFKAFCRTYPKSPIVLVDTYDTLGSGVPNAIKVFKELGITDGGIRLDSGDLSFLTKKARKMLDDAGLTGIRITVSNSLDEWIIRDLIEQGACIDSFGVGDNLITSHSDPVFNGVYKLAAVEDDDGNIIPKIKISECVEKITTPHFKKIYRLFDSDGKAFADLLCLHDEVIDDSQPLTIFDPDATWKKKTITDFTAKELMVPIFKDGELVYDVPDLDDVRAYSLEQVDLLWDEVKRFHNPHSYYVDLSQKLWDIKQSMIRKARNV